MRLGFQDPRVVVKLGVKLPYFFGIEIYQAPTIAEIRPGDCQGVMDKRTHRPRGTMCSRCVSRLKDCSALPFERMRVIGKDAEGLKVVICEQYELQKECKITIKNTRQNPSIFIN
jgi:hypothetical protein